MSNHNLDNLRACFDAHRGQDLTGSEFAEAVLKEAKKSAEAYVAETGIHGLSLGFSTNCRDKVMINYLVEAIANMYDEVTP